MKARGEGGLEGAVLGGQEGGGWDGPGARGREVQWRG